MMITYVEDYFQKGCGRCDRFDTADCSAKIWTPGLLALRKICLDVGLTETVKWGHPCYEHAGRNICVMGAFRKDFRLTFFNAALMKDPENILRKKGENTAHPDMLSFNDTDEVSIFGPVIRAYLKEAMTYAEAGIKPAKLKQTLELPIELQDAFLSDPELAEAFDRLTPGRQKSYILNLNSAKQSKTRKTRIKKFRDKILSGKGALER